MILSDHKLNSASRGGEGGGRERARRRTALTIFVHVSMSVCSHWRKTILV